MHIVTFLFCIPTIEESDGQGRGVHISMGRGLGGGCLLGGGGCLLEGRHVLYLRKYAIVLDFVW